MYKNSFYQWPYIPPTFLKSPRSSSIIKESFFLSFLFFILSRSCLSNEDTTQFKFRGIWVFFFFFSFLHVYIIFSTTYDQNLSFKHVYIYIYISLCKFFLIWLIMWINFVNLWCSMIDLTMWWRFDF